jgi:serine/threonine-protein kinase
VVELKLGRVTQEYSSRAEKGVVMSQSPESGTQAAKDSTVSITVSKGTEMVAVPDLAGLTQDAATQALAAAGLQTQVETESSTAVAEGSLISQTPAAGENVAKGSTVTITVAKQETVLEVPNVVGMNQDAAVSALEEKGFTVNVIQTVDPTKTAGKVYKQAPSAASSATPGSSVTIYVWAKKA